MDQQLQERLRLYGQEGLASADIVAFVHDILLWLERISGRSCTEENAGTMTSHLMLALDRMKRGEELGTFWDAEVHEEAQTLTAAQPWVEYICQQVQLVLGLEVPDEEKDFIMLHLGAFQLSDPIEACKND